MLRIRNDQVGNHFSEKFISLCHVDYFINGVGQKLTVRYKFYLLDTCLSTKTKWLFTLKLIQFSFSKN